MVAWYKHDIPAWMDGTEALDDGPYRAYHVICQLIYLNEGPIALNETGIAGRCKQHILTFRRNLRTLIELKKLTLIDGRLSNDRAATELQSVAEHRATSAKGGRGSAGVAKGSGRGTKEVGAGSQEGPSGKPLISQDTTSSALLEPQHHKTREEKTREESKYCPDAKAPRTRQVYSEEFETKFWQPYPRTPTMSKSEAWKSWSKLTPEQRAASCQALDPYKRHLQSKPNLETVHACRFLSQQRFEGFLNGAAGKPQAIDIRSSLV